VSFKSILNDHFANVKLVKGKQLIATKIDLRVNFGIINYPIINTNFLYSIMREASYLESNYCLCFLVTRQGVFVL